MNLRVLNLKTRCQFLMNKVKKRRGTRECVQRRLFQEGICEREFFELLAYHAKSGSGCQAFDMSSRSSSTHTLLRVLAT